MAFLNELHSDYVENGKNLKPIYTCAYVQRDYQTSSLSIIRQCAQWLGSQCLGHFLFSPLSSDQATSTCSTSCQDGSGPSAPDRGKRAKVSSVPQRPPPPWSQMRSLLALMLKDFVLPPIDDELIDEDDSGYFLSLAPSSSTFSSTHSFHVLYISGNEDNPSHEEEYECEEEPVFMILEGSLPASRGSKRSWILYLLLEEAKGVKTEAEEETTNPCLMAGENLHRSDEEETLLQVILSLTLLEVFSSSFLSDCPEMRALSHPHSLFRFGKSGEHFFIHINCFGLVRKIVDSFLFWLLLTISNWSASDINMSFSFGIQKDFELCVIRSLEFFRDEMSFHQNLFFSHLHFGSKVGLKQVNGDSMENGKNPKPIYTYAYVQRSSRMSRNV
ncbi:hypothetical protein M5K25_004742 [Dendrobium thyrsiflorum]|uniref:Uncharacterized protein n=1 Tax=Dendrobium thyrsiflorum TaxID=117978 RepID=A0ABD0VFX2_DENTH